MDWKKANERLPRDQEEVLLHYHSLITIAVFDAQKEKFISKSSKAEYGKTPNLWWSSLDLAPEHQRG